MAITHAKKHDINSGIDHIKTDLDLTGKLSLTAGTGHVLDVQGDTTLLTGATLPVGTGLYFGVYGSSLASQVTYVGAPTDRYIFTSAVEAPSFFGDGSGLTNITAEALNISANEWLYFNYPTNTIGVRYNTTPVPAWFETNVKFYAPNIESGNAIVCNTHYSDYHIIGNRTYSPGIAHQVFYMVNPSTLKVTYTMGEDGSQTFYGCDLNNSYISWKDSTSPTPLTQAGIGVYNNSGTYELEIYTQNTTTDPIQMYSTTNLWEDTAIQDGKYLHFNTARTKNLWYDGVTNNRFEFNDSVYTAGDFYAYGALNLTAGNEVEFNYGATAKTLIWSSANTRFEFNDKLKAPNARIGGDTDYTEFDTSGTQTMAGTARYNETLQWTANQLSAIAGTYNAITNNASTAGTLNGFYFRVFDDGPTAEACNTAFVLPTKYVAGADFTVSFCWTVGGTSTNAVRWQAGCARVMAGETYSPITSVDTWGTPVNVAAPGTTWARVRTDITVSGTGFQAGDLVRLIVFRDGGNAGDTYTGDAYISCVGVSFLCDRL